MTLEQVQFEVTRILHAHAAKLERAANASRCVRAQEQKRGKWAMDSAILGDHHCFRSRCDPIRLVITDAIAAAQPDAGVWSESAGCETLRVPYFPVPTVLV